MYRCVSKSRDGLAFEKYHSPEDYLAVPLEELMEDIRSIGLYRNKAKNIQGLSEKILTEFNGKYQRRMRNLRAFQV